MKRWFLVSSVTVSLVLSAVSGWARSDGWPEEMKGVKLRFLRLEHDGIGWDDGMGPKTANADANFLRFFSRATGFKAARVGESHTIRALTEYPVRESPPFVYITGNGRMGRLSAEDIKILRDYCLRGGLLIADAGSYAFHRSFLELIRQIFPEKLMVDIADDDSLYQVPYRFPEGAPGFWGHGGRRALGIKHAGRWCLFYHPGGMNDAWKSASYSEVSPEKRQAAMNLGVNLVYYSLESYWLSQDERDGRNQPVTEVERPEPQPAEDPPPEAPPVEVEKDVEDADTVCWKAVLDVATRLQESGFELKEKAILLGKRADDPSRAEAAYLDGLSHELYKKAAHHYGLLLARFPDHDHAGMVALKVGQNWMRAEAYIEGREAFQAIIDNDAYDEDLRAQATYWRAVGRERMPDGGLQEAFLEYTGIVANFPTSQWAKYARGRLQDPVFVKLAAPAENE